MRWYRALPIKANSKLKPCHCQHNDTKHCLYLVYLLELSTSFRLRLHLYPHGNNMGFFSVLSHSFFDAGIMAWDVLLTVSNPVRRKYPIGDVTPEGHPGYGGHWPEFIPPQLTDSRCSCPAFNAMANHGESFGWWISLAWRYLKPRHHLAQRPWGLVCRAQQPYPGNLQLQSYLLFFRAALSRSHA